MINVDNLYVFAYFYWLVRKATGLYQNVRSYFKGIFCYFESIFNHILRHHINNPSYDSIFFISPGILYNIVVFKCNGLKQK